LWLRARWKAAGATAGRAPALLHQKDAGRVQAPWVK
jgi:hypothetical protein